MAEDWSSMFGDFLNSNNISRISGVEYENKLNDMWKAYCSGNVKQLPTYQKQLQDIKDAGYKVLRNNDGKHKVISRGGM